MQRDILTVLVDAKAYSFEDVITLLEKYTEPATTVIIILVGKKLFIRVVAGMPSSSLTCTSFGWPEEDKEGKPIEMVERWISEAASMRKMDGLECKGLSFLPMFRYESHPEAAYYVNHFPGIGVDFLDHCREPIWNMHSLKCGEDLTWLMIDERTLSISGTGTMNDYQRGEAPWYGLIDVIEKVFISEKVEGIGNYAFADCRSLTTIKMPESLKRIGQGAFSGCRSIVDINIPLNVNEICSQAFSDCSLLTFAVLGGYRMKIGNEAFSGCRNLVYAMIPEDAMVAETAFEGTYIDPEHRGILGGCTSHSEEPKGEGPLWSRILKRAWRKKK